MSTDFSPPVAAMLMDAEPDYKTLGITKAHIPELIALGTDKTLLLDDERRDAAVAAWQALGYLKAEDAVDPLIALLPLVDEDVYPIIEDLPGVMAQIGEASILPLAAYMNEGDVYNGRIAAVTALTAVAQAMPNQQERIADLFEQALTNYAKQENEFNGYLVMGLVRTQARDTASLIEEAFEAKKVDPFIIGDWTKVQIELGLTTYEEIRSKDRPDGSRPPSLREVIADGLEDANPKKKNATKRKVDKDKKKSKRKQASKSRKKNRK